MKFSSILVLAAITGTSTALESTCCNALESEGCTDPAFPLKNFWTWNGIQVVTCCGSGGVEVNKMNGNPTCAGSDIQASDLKAASCKDLGSQLEECPCAVQCQDGETKCVEETDGAFGATDGSTDYSTKNCYASQQRFCTDQGSWVKTACEIYYNETTGLWHNRSNTDGDYVTYSTPTDSTPSPTPSAGFASSTSVTIGASVAFLAMIFV